MTLKEKLTITTKGTKSIAEYMQILKECYYELAVVGAPTMDDTT